MRNRQSVLPIKQENDFWLAKNTGKPYNINRICRLLTGAGENALFVYATAVKS